MFDKIGFDPRPPPQYSPSTMPPGHDPLGQIWKILYLISSTLQALRFDMLYDHVWQNWIFLTPPPPLSPKYHPQGMTHGPNLKNIVFNFFYSSSPSIWYATWPCLTKFYFWPPPPPAPPPPPPHTHTHTQGMTQGSHRKTRIRMFYSHWYPWLHTQNFVLLTGYLLRSNDNFSIFDLWPRPPAPGWGSKSKHRCAHLQT